MLPQNHGRACCVNNKNDNNNNNNNNNNTCDNSRWEILFKSGQCKSTLP